MTFRSVSMSFGSNEEFRRISDREVYPQGDVLVQDLDVVGRPFAGREGVHLPADGVDLDGDLLGRPPLRPLEEKVLDEVGDAVDFLRLVPGADAHPDADGDRADAGNRLGDDPDPVWQNVLSKHGPPDAGDGAPAYPFCAAFSRSASLRREADLAGPVDLQDLHQDFFPFLELVGNIRHPVLGDLGDVHEAVRPGENLDERPEVHDLPHLAEVDLPDLRVGDDAGNDLHRLPRRGLVHRSDVDETGILHVDLGARLLDDPADHLPAGADDVPDLVRPDLHREDPRGVDRQVRPGLGDGLRHLPQDVDAALPRLLQGPGENVPAKPGDLRVDLDRRHAARRPGHLEIHVAQMVLDAQDVREDDDVVPLFDQAHGDSRHGGLDRHAGVHQGERPAADGGHRGGAVRLEDVGDDPYRVGEVRLVGNHGPERPLGQRPVADLAPPGPPQGLDLADGERRKVVMEHERLEALPFQGVDPLLVVRSAESRHDETLRLAASENGRTVRPRKDPDLG